MLLISLSFAHIFTWTCWQNTYLEHCLILAILPIELIQAYPRQMRIIFALKFSYKFSHNQNYSRVSHARSWKPHVLNSRNRLTQNKRESPHVRHLSYKEKQMRIKINSNLSYLWASTQHLSISNVVNVAIQYHHRLRPYSNIRHISIDCCFIIVAHLSQLY